MLEQYTKMENKLDTQLIEKYLKGDKESLEILISRYLKLVYSFVRQIIYDEAEAEDVTQDVFVRVWKNLKKFDQQKNFKTWIFSIAKNASIDFLRKKKAVPMSAFDNEDGGNAVADNLASLSPLPDEIVERADAANLIKSAVEKLSENYRTVLYLKYYSDLTFKKISEMTGVPLHTAKSRYRRALAALREILAGTL